jgi:hypothetical protein
MLQFRNRTPFEGTILLLPDADGVDSVYAVVKATFRLGETLSVAEAQVPVVVAPLHYAEPATTSIRIPGDVSLQKPATDVVLVGSAWAPGGRPTWQMDVSLACGPVGKTLRVSGDRVWRSGAAGTSVSWVEPFERMPLVWERAFGGTDETEKGPVAEPRNPVGRGFRARDSVKALDGMPLPNVEDPGVPITGWRDAPPPAGFAPVAAHWQPRASYAGTYDAAWEKNRAPYLPADFDARFFQVAPAGLVAPGYLTGGELVDLRGVTPTGTLRFLLPTVRLRVTYRLDSGEEQRTPVLDTVVLEPDANRMMLVWRSVLATDKKSLKVREVEAAVDGGSVA